MLRLPSAECLSCCAETTFDSVLPSLVKLRYAAEMDVEIQRLNRTAEALMNRPDQSSRADKFESLLGQISTSFVGVTADEIDGAIEHWLRRIGRALRVDRSTVAQFDPAERLMVVTHQWAAEGISPVPNKLNASAVLPWLASRMLAGEAVAFASIDELPPDAAADVQAIQTFGMPQSSVCLPLSIGGSVVGAFTVGAFTRERKWSDLAVNRLRLVADVFSNALARKHTVGEMRHLRNELQQASKVSMMGELTAWLAHEVNQPLSAILSNAQAARRFLTARHPNLSEVRAALDEIVGDNARAVEAIRNVRALFQTGEAEMSPLPLSSVLTDFERIVRADARRRNIALRLTTPPALPSVTGVRTQLLQALLNLAVNAFDALPDDWPGPRRVEILAEQQEPARVAIAVIDSGKGIDPTIMPRLFQAFVTTKPKGMGVGLAIARTIIEKHGGRLWAESNAECGTSMCFYLPVLAPPLKTPRSLLGGGAN